MREGVLVDQRQIVSHVLPLASRIGKTEIDEFDLFVLDQFQDGLCISHSGLPYLERLKRIVRVLNRVCPFFPSPDSDSFLDVEHEYFAVANTAGPRSL